MTSRLSLLLLLLPIILSLAADARPCKTLTGSTYSFSLLPLNPNPNPNPNFIAIITDFRPEIRPEFLPYRRPVLVAPYEEEFSSFKDRTKDILGVVVSLLFGAACGALTTGTVYLLWSLFTRINESYPSSAGFSSVGDDEDDEDDIFNPKKGYVSIPAALTNDPAKETA